MGRNSIGSSRSTKIEKVEENDSEETDYEQEEKEEEEDVVILDSYIKVSNGNKTLNALLILAIASVIHNQEWNFM